ncbi:MAG TPA: ABC transporter permease [Rhizobiaceae bacterium]|nr:ABC transporter permease [Rhizobiaceae bacterium]
MSEAVTLALYIARSDIRSRYARSVLGSFWITVQQAIFVGVAAAVFPAVFGAPLESYVPFFAVSLLMWTFFSTALLESMDTLSANAAMIKDRGFSPSVFLLATFFKGIMMTAHAAPVPILLALWFGAVPFAGFLQALPGLAFFFITAAGAAYGLGLAAARFRDLKRLMESVIQLAFLVTPILWQPHFVRERSSLIVDVNPLAHLFIAWRQPLLGDGPNLFSLAMAALVALAAVAFAWAMSRAMSRIALWV